MADEVLGHVYEVITQIALEDYTKVFRKGEQAFYEQKPKGITIKPDLTIGVDKDNPRIIFQIHHTNAESASHHKFWRNIGEFVDARLALGSKTIIANIVFDSGQKRQLAVVSEALFDGFLEADRAVYGKDLLKLGEDLTVDIKKGKVAKVDRVAFVRGELKANPKAKKTVQSFAVELEATLSATSKLSSGWFGASQAVHKTRPTPRIPARRVTTVRRGLGRLLPIPDEIELRRVLTAIRSQSPIDVPPYMVALGLATPVAGGKKHRIEDPEIVGLCQIITDDEVVALWRDTKKSSQSLRQASFSIAQSNDFPKFHQFVAKNVSKLSTMSGLRTALEDCYKNPDTVLGENLGLTNPDQQGNWLFEYLMVAIKASTGKQQGYGYTRLGDESGFRFEIAATAGVVLSPYLQRRKPLPKDILNGIATALSKRIAGLSGWIPGAYLDIAGFYLRGLFEDKIYKIAAFDPLALLIVRYLGKVSGTRNKRTPTLLTEVLGKKGIATTDVMHAGNKMIVWQSASDKGVAHKTKELMGRIGMLRVTRSAKDGLVPKSDVAKVALVIDGTWSVAHIQRLVEAGADGIFYPDEMDKLAAFLK